MVGTFDGHGTHQAVDGPLGGRVGGEIAQAEQSRPRAGHDDLAVVLLHHGGPCGARHIDVSADVNAPEVLVILQRRLLEREFVADAGVVHDDIECAELIERLLHQCTTAFFIRDIIAVGDGLAAAQADQLDYFIRDDG